MGMAWTAILFALLITMLVFSIFVAPGIALIIIFAIRRKRGSADNSNAPVVEATFTDPDAQNDKETANEQENQ